MSELDYNASSLGAFRGVELIVSDYVGDDQIILKRRKHHKNGGQFSTHRLFAAYDLSIWNIKLGTITGDCPPGQATEMHVSPKIYLDIVLKCNQPSSIN